MKRLKIFMFFLILTTISIVVYFIFEVDIQAYLVSLFADEKSDNKTNKPITFGLPNYFVQSPVTPPVTPPVVPPVTPPVTPPIKPPVTPPVVVPPVNLSAGEAVFNYLEILEGKAIPLDGKPQANGLMKILFPSHSRVCTQVSKTPQNANAYCEYKLINSKGQVIVHLRDTIGGFHSNFFDAGQRTEKGNEFYKWVDEWANSFKPFGVFGSFADRGNNHFDAYNKYVLEGDYTFWYHNLSNTAHSVTGGFVRAGNGENAFNTIVEPNGKFEKTFPLTPNGNEWDDFKINTNNYTL